MDRIEYLKLLTNLSEYERGDKLFDQTIPGNYSLDILTTGKYEIVISGAGGGGGSGQRDNKWFNSFGGGGAAFIGICKLKKGNYSLTVGAGGYGKNNGNSNNINSCTNGGFSSITYNEEVLFNAGGGLRGNDYRYIPGGVMTISPNVNIKSQTVNSNGNSSKGWRNANRVTGSLEGGNSLITNNYDGPGAGRGSWHGQGLIYGISGMIRITYEGL